MKRYCQKLDKTILQNSEQIIFSERPKHKTERRYAEHNDRKVPENQSPRKDASMEVGTLIDLQRQDLTHKLTFEMPAKNLTWL